MSLFQKQIEIKSQDELDSYLEGVFGHSLKHFSFDELKCKNCCDVLKLSKKSVNFLFQLDGFRSFLSKSFGTDIPIHVTNNYRCPIKNQKVSGSPKSFHLESRAVDVYSDYVSNKSFFLKAVEFGFKGIGVYPDRGFIHLDNRFSTQYWVCYQGQYHYFKRRKSVLRFLEEL